MKTLVRHTAVLAVTTAVVLLSAHAGYCGNSINPQPLPPCHPNPMAQILHLVLALLHVTG